MEDSTKLGHKGCNLLKKKMIYLNSILKLNYKATFGVKLATLRLNNKGSNTLLYIKYSILSKKNCPHRQEETV